MKKSLQILLVEDDPDDVELLREALKENQVLYSIDVVMQGDEVIPHLEQSILFPEVILLDLNLPKVHGRDILKLLKTQSSFTNVPVIILTTSSAKADVDFCLELGAEKFITKPTSKEGFDEMVTAIIETVSAKKPGEEL